MDNKNYFKTLYDIDVSDKTKTKNGLTYLSWAAAWAEIKKLFPEATYMIYENEVGYNYHTDGKTAWVKTSVTVNGIENIDYLPVMDFKNKSVPVDNITSTDVNKAIQRSLVRCLAKHGLGLYIYEGDDLPEAVSELDEINEENLALATKLAKESAELKKTVGDLVRTYVKGRTANPKLIKDLDVAKELNEKLKEL